MSEQKATDDDRALEGAIQDVERAFKRAKQEGDVRTMSITMRCKSVLERELSERLDPRGERRKTLADKVEERERKPQVQYRAG